TASAAPPVSEGFASSASGPRTSLLIGQPLADNALKNAARASFIIATERLSIAVTELKLGEVTVQMLLGAMLIDATHTALEDAERALNGVRCYVAANIFLVVVMDGGMLGKLTANAAIHDVLVGH